MDSITKDYLDLLKKSLSGSLLSEYYRPIYRDSRNLLTSHIRNFIIDSFDNLGMPLAKKVITDFNEREEGLDRPFYGETLIGLKRLNIVQNLIHNAIKNKIPGDFIEAGCFRGGVGIFVFHMLKILGENNRKIYLADSFQGLPKPNPKNFPKDTIFLNIPKDLGLICSIDTVKNNFRKYNALGPNVKFLKGWFSDTLPKLKNEKFFTIRVDGDYYQSTYESLENLYPGLSLGGYAIMDDYGLNVATSAIIDFRKKYNIKEEMKFSGKIGCYWEKMREI